MFRKTFKGDSEKVQISLKDVLKGVLREFEGSFKGLSRELQEDLKEIQRNFLAASKVF